MRDSRGQMDISLHKNKQKTMNVVPEALLTLEASKEEGSGCFSFPAKCYRGGRYIKAGGSVCCSCLPGALP